VDYLAVASRSYLGNPKNPTIFVCMLAEDGVYQMNSYQGKDVIISPTFSSLNITVEQILGL
jgi:Uma2 family endonuclease